MEEPNITKLALTIGNETATWETPFNDCNIKDILQALKGLLVTHTFNEKGFEYACARYLEEHDWKTHEPDDEQDDETAEEFQPEPKQYKDIRPRVQFLNDSIEYEFDGQRFLSEEKLTSIVQDISENIADGKACEYLVNYCDYTNIDSDKNYLQLVVTYPDAEDKDEPVCTLKYFFDYDNWKLETLVVLNNGELEFLEDLVDTLNEQYK